MLYLAGAAGRDVQRMSFGWQAMPMFEHATGCAGSARRHVRQSSVQAMQVLSLSPNACSDGSFGAGAAAGGGDDGCAGGVALSCATASVPATMAIRNVSAVKT